MPLMNTIFQSFNEKPPEYIQFNVAVIPGSLLQKPAWFRFWPDDLEETARMHNSQWSYLFLGCIVPRSRGLSVTSSINYYKFQVIPPKKHDLPLASWVGYVPGMQWRVHIKHSTPENPFKRADEFYASILLLTPVPSILVMVRWLWKLVVCDVYIYICIYMYNYIYTYKLYIYICMKGIRLCCHP